MYGFHMVACFAIAADILLLVLSAVEVVFVFRRCFMGMSCLAAYIL